MINKYTFGEKFRSLLATGRMANLPTVWTNVLVGLGITALAIKADRPSYTIMGADFTFLAILLLATSFLYIGGCMLGDYRDLSFDKKHRPNRPLPLGVLKAPSVAIASLLLLLAGLVLAIFTSAIATILESLLHDDALSITEISNFLYSCAPSVQSYMAFLLTCSIIIYAFTHKKTKKYALMNMALCRFFLVALSCSTLAPILWNNCGGAFNSYSIHFITLALLFAISVALHTFLLSSVASTESTPEQYGHRKTLSKLLLSLPFLGLAARYMIELIDKQVLDIFSENVPSLLELPHIGVLITAIIICSMWSLYAIKALDTSKPVFVSRALAGFCLLDMCFAATFSTTLALICLALFGVALLLQRIAPAT